MIHCCYFHRGPPPTPVASSQAAAAAVPAEDPLIRLPLGSKVHVRGGLQEYRDCKQVVVYSLRLVTDPNEESARVFRLDALYRSVYNREAPAREPQ